MKTPARQDILARRESILAPLDPHRYTAFHRLVTDEKHRLVVCFGGGSVPGLCGNVALAAILEELDVRPHVQQVWGTSAGAAIGGPWATGTPAQTIYDEVAALNRRGSLDVAWLRLLWAILCKPFGGKLPDGLVYGRHFSQAVENALSVETFEACPVSFRCIACSDDGLFTRKVFRRGPLLPAIFSSMSIPGVVIPKPVGEGQETYYDGGLVEKTPMVSPIAEHLRTHPEQRLVLVGTHFNSEGLTHRKSQGFLVRFLDTIDALESLAWNYQLKDVRAKPNTELVLLNPRIQDPSLFDFSRVEVNYLQARENLADALQNGKLALSFGLR